MRKLVLTTLQSLDGAVDNPENYFAPAPDGGSPTFDDDMHANEAAIIGRQDAVILGRHMYEEWSEYWPTVPDQQFAKFINNVRKYVVTSQPLSRDWPNSQAVSAPVDEFVRTLKAQPGLDIGIHGSITLARSLLAAGLVDELQLVVAPALGFAGRRLIDDAASALHLEPISARGTRSGGLLLAYRLSNSARV